MNNELVSREALKKAFEVTQYNDYDDLKRTESLIDNAPTVEEKSYAMGYQDGLEDGLDGIRPQGEWVVQRLQSGFDDVYCPYCNARPTRSEYGYYLRDNFCHECGADMRKGGADNDT